MAKFMLTLFICVVVFFASEAQDDGCPPSTQIEPCYCFSDLEFNLYLDCNAVESDEELRNVFQYPFPFNNFALLTIIKIPGGENLNILANGTFGTVEFEEIEIIGTSLKTIEPDAFKSSVAALKRLVLRNNEVYSFSLDHLEPFTDLETVDISENQAASVSDAFSDSLTTLFIDNNQLSQLSLSLLTSAQNIVLLKAENNNINGIQSGTFTGLASIDEIDLSDNNIRTLVDGTMDLVSDSLTKLFMSNNQIETIEENFINQINPFSSIKLQNNSISSIEEAVWSPILNMISDTNAQAVDFSDNPLLCGCDVFWLVADETQLSKISIDTRCLDGTYLYQLDVNALNASCSTFQ